VNNTWNVIAQNLPQAIVETLIAVAFTMVLGGVLGFILGAALYATRKGSLLQNGVVFNILNVLINIFRPIPFIILIAFIQPFTLFVAGTSIGLAGAIVPMTVAASFAFARVVEQNLVATDPGVVEAARAMGAGPLRIIVTVLVPESLGPQILSYTFMFVLVVGESALAGYIGGGGIGNFAILYGYQQYNYPVTLVAVIVIIVIVQLGQFLGNFLARRVLRR
jgi:D-methionine transport system permease protein